MLRPTEVTNRDSAANHTVRTVGLSNSEAGLKPYEKSKPRHHEKEM